MSTEKKYLKSKPTCRVKFIAPKPLVDDAKKIYLAGDFNQWAFETTPLRKQKNGDLATTLELEVGNEYSYRYVLDGERWENDFTADKYIPNGVSADDNSVVVI